MSSQEQFAISMSPAYRRGRHAAVTDMANTPAAEPVTRYSGRHGDDPYSPANHPQPCPHCPRSPR